MKQKLPIIGIVLIFIIGLGVLSYPLISSAVNNYAARQQAENYTKTVKKMPTERQQELLASAKKYNDSLTNNVIITDPFDKEAYEKIGKEYMEAMDVDGRGLIGYIDVPKINVMLPINHSTSEEVLAHSAGHLQNTSMPIGGESTHAVISAHSAFPGQTFFDYLTEIKVGDEFYVRVLNRVLKYEVDQIKTVLPEETDDLRIVRGEDHVTLVTCTPYSVNTHRLLVRGKRVEFDDSEYITTGAKFIDMGEGHLFFLGYKIPYWAAGLVIAGVVAMTAFFVVFFVRRGKKHRHEKEKNRRKQPSEAEREVDG